ncbi:MAG TPA: glycosyl hydrolase [Solirubrobacterales bacterium]|nr:glycosyl hydrolase [Solirubrobacterales bacterium]
MAMLATLLALSVLPAAGDAASGTSKPAPAQPSSYWGAWIGSQLTGESPPWDMSAVDKFSELAGKGLSLVEFSAPFTECEGSTCKPDHFPADEMTEIRNYGAIPFFSWGSQSIPMEGPPIQPSFSLSRIIAGDYDSYLTEFAEAARAWGNPFFLRFDWEMNGNWLPWGEGANGNNPGEFVAAWRHVHDIFTAVGATNATWVWCPYAFPTRPLAALKRSYPGNSYVDWTCLDGYNWGNNTVNPHPWRSFDAIFHHAYGQVVKGVAPKKPMLLAEVASGGSAHAKARWISQMFKALRTRYRRIRGLIWFDQVDRGVQWQIETSQGTSRAFARGIHPPAFKGNEFQQLTGPIRPPR